MNTRISIVVVVVVLVVVSAYYIFSQPQPEEAAVKPPALAIKEAELELITGMEVVPKQAPDTTATPVNNKIEVPSDLVGSDLKVLLAVADMSTDLAQWLTPEEQIRKWVLFVDNAANGDLIALHRPWQYAMKPLTVVNIGDNQYLAPANYQRATPLLNAVMAMPPARLADYYYNWLPLLEQAYRELGKKGSFDVRFKAAIDNVLAVKSLSVEPALKRPSVMYQYQDKSLDAASDINKLMWRLGAENTQNIQSYLLTLKSHL